MTGTSGNDLITPTATVAGQPRPGAGNDSIAGRGGHDTIDGGGGADTMAGGAGNDTYFIDNLADVVTEASNAGVDTEQSAVTRVLEAFAEHLVLTGTGATNATGNGLGNSITGNGSANTVTGLGATIHCRGRAV